MYVSQQPPSCLQILGQGGVFRQMVQVLRGNGGVNGLKVARAEAATTNTLKHLLPMNTASDGALQSDRFGTTVAAGTAGPDAGSICKPRHSSVKYTGSTPEVRCHYHVLKSAYQVHLGVSECPLCPVY